MNFRNLVMWAIIVFLTIGLYNMFKHPQNIQQTNNISFSEFLNEVDNGRVAQVDIQGNNISGILSNGKNFNTYAPNDPNLVEKLTDKGVGITATPIEDKMPSLLGVLLSWFPMLLLVGVWIFFMRQMQGGKGGAMGFGRSKAKLIKDSKKKVTFDDVAGIEEAKEEVQEVVEFLRDPRKFARLGGKIPRGVLLVGSPGTGKTLLAKAIAGEADVPFFTISGSDFVEMFVGVGAERKSMVMTAEDKKLTAYHEGGHAIVALNEKASDPIHKATIIPRGRALGVVWTLPERDKYSLSREYIEANISKAMGGRIAEELIFGHEKVTSGAASDLQMATKLAKDMVTRFGMSNELGPLTYGENEDEVFLGRSITRHQQMSEETANKVDSEIKKIVDAGYKRAKKILTEKIDDLHKLAKALILYETLTGDEIKDLIFNNKSPKNKKDEKEDEKEKSSALGSLGLKPKPAH